MGVLEAMADAPRPKTTIQEMRRSFHKALAGMALNFPAMIRTAANQLIARYAMTAPVDVDRIEPDVMVVEKVVAGVIQRNTQTHYSPNPA